ncbi:MAG: DUF1801 domain-containing protein [Ornithinimicrobium sp.]
MQSSAATPEEFLASLDPDWRRETLTQLRDIIHRQAPELDESMHYKMLGYSAGDEFIFHLNAQRNYVSLYVGDVSKVDPEGVLLDGLDVGKGCIRFRRSTPVATTRIDDFVARTIDRWNRGEDVRC